jgi:hypothetical protein
MADWKQITARIRRARTSKDPAGQLTNLFSKTRDAMVAFELARYFESSGNSSDAGKWYLTAAQRFRRSDWKTKAQESAARLGATESAEIPAAQAKLESAAPPEAAAASESRAHEEEEQTEVVSDRPGTETQPVPPPSRSLPPNRQRRGRRGGRDQRSSRRSQSAPSAKEARFAPTASVPADSAEPVERPAASALLEVVPEAPAPSLRGRYGDPGLASRLTQLEMNFRRLLACSPAKIQDADAAPAGPGVWLLTDSDQTTYYYVEACQTLRVAIPNLLRGNAARRGEPSIKPQLAEHLGIPESRVAKYLSDHCVVRWLQMDEGASHFAHFLIAVLRPTLNE